jgi:hypothetical protein
VGATGNLESHALLWAGTRDSVVDLHPAGFTESTAIGVAGGTQVGYGYSDATANYYHALKWNGSAESAVDLHPPGWAASKIAATDGQQHAGWVYPASDLSRPHAALWTGNGAEIIDLHQFLPAGVYRGSSAHAIAADGTIVGTAETTATDSWGFTHYHAVMWRPGTPPSAPRSLTARAGDARISLAWTAPSSAGSSPITGYRIYRGGSAGGPKTLLTSVGAITSYTDTEVSNGTTYYYQVSAVSAAGEGDRSSEASATPQAAAPPSAPQNLSASTAGKGRGVSLNWQAPASSGSGAVTGYRIYRGTSSSAKSLLATAGTVTTYTDTQTKSGTRYYYQVSAVNSAGEGPLSNEAGATSK